MTRLADRSETEHSIKPTSEMDMPKRRPLGDAEDVAQLCRIPKSTVYELARRGEFPGVIRLGRTMRFDMDRIEAWLEEQGNG